MREGPRKLDKLKNKEWWGVAGGSPEQEWS